MIKQQLNKEILIQYIVTTLKTSQNGIWIKVDGSCMTPIIYPGEFVKVVKNEKYNVGDIVLRLMGNCVYTHRVVYLKNDIYITKGDNAFFTDCRCAYPDILGKITCKKSSDGIERILVPRHQLWCIIGALVSGLSGACLDKHAKGKSKLEKKFYYVLNMIARWFSHKILHFSYLNLIFGHRKTTS
jgi:SOS-response transcriptional repressors (RecA-mediated autopeptidases)